MINIKFNEEIYKKALQRNKEMEYEDTCVKSLICPVCGSQLDVRVH